MVILCKSFVESDGLTCNGLGTDVASTMLHRHLTRRHALNPLDASHKASMCKRTNERTYYTCLVKNALDKVIIGVNAKALPITSACARTFSGESAAAVSRLLLRGGANTAHLKGQDIQIMHFEIRFVPW